MATTYHFKKPLLLGLKGFTGLLIIKAVMFIGILVFQACQKNNDVSANRSVQQAEAKKFRALLQQKAPVIKQLLSGSKQSVEKGNKTAKKPRTTLATVPTDEFLPPDPEAPQVYIEGYGAYDGSYTYQQVEAIRVEVTPVVDQGRALIYSYGITDQDLIEEWGTASDPELITRLAYGISGYEEAVRESSSQFELIGRSFFGSSAYAGGLWECVKSAIGVEAAMEVLRDRSLSTYAGRKAFVRAIGKTATRYLGWVGAAIAVADFIDCYW